MAAVNCQDFQKMIAQAVFQADLTVLPVSFYIGLGTGVLPQKTATLADIVEVSGPGYERKQLTRGLVAWPGLILVGGNWKVTADTRRWEPSGGDWTAADYAFMTDVPSGTVGRLFTCATLEEPFLALDGDSWDGAAEWIGSP